MPQPQRHDVAGRGVTKNVDEAFFKQCDREGYISDELKEQYGLEPKSGLPVKLDDMVVKDYRLEKPCRVYVGMANRNKLLEFIKNGCNSIIDEGTPLKFYLNANAGVRYSRENEKPRNILSVLKGLGTTEKTKTYLKSLGIYYDYAKPVGLIEYLIKVGCEDDAIVMDFFAGSGTTAEAVLNLNSVENAKRRFVCVQLPERPANDLGNRNGIDSNLAKIAEKRIGAAIKGIRERNPMFAGDVGFRVFKLDSSNIRAWDPNANNLADAVQDSIEHLKADRTDQDILFEVLLKLGLDLCIPIETKKFGGSNKKPHDVHSIGGGTLYVCLSTSIPQADVESLALGLVKWHKQLQPAVASTVVFRDSAFADDVAKTNLAAILQQHGLETVRSL